MDADPTIAAVWNRVMEHWGDESVHAAFLRYCQDTEQLGAAASRYAAARAAAHLSPIAEKRLHAVSILATSSLLATKTERRRGLPRWFTALALAAFGTLAAYALVHALR